MKKTKIFLAVFFSFFFISAQASAAVYQVDPKHSAVSFKVRHLFSFVAGAFGNYQGQIEFDPAKPGTWKAEGTIETATIDTRVEERDKHLRSADFFNVEKFPQILFHTTKVLESSADKARVEGVLTMHGVEKPVVLDVDILGVGKDPWGGTRAGFTAKTKLNRKDFGINWNKALDNGGMLVGDEVLVTLEIEAAQKA